MAKHPITEAEIKRAKDSILNAFIFNLDSPDKILRERMAYEFYGYPQDYLEKFRAGVEKVTPADVARVAAKYLHKDKLAMLVVGNPAEFDKAAVVAGPSDQRSTSRFRRPRASNRSRLPGSRSTLEPHTLDRAPSRLCLGGDFCFEEYSSPFVHWVFLYRHFYPLTSAFAFRHNRRTKGEYMASLPLLPLPDQNWSESPAWQPRANRSARDTKSNTSPCRYAPC